MRFPVARQGKSSFAIVPAGYDNADGCIVRHLSIENARRMKVTPSLIGSEAILVTWASGTRIFLSVRQAGIPACFASETQQAKARLAHRLQAYVPSYAILAKTGLPSRSSLRACGNLKCVSLGQGFGASSLRSPLRCERRLEPRGFEPLTSSMPLRRSTN